MELTTKQREGLEIAVERHRAGCKYTVISGYAGTGKSTLVRWIIDALNVQEDRVAYATFTGKAAEVLRKMGNKNSCTLHRLLYDHVPRPGGGFYRKKKPTIDYDIVVVDEISMVPIEMVDLLFSHKVYVLCLGDPAQLSPIDKTADNHLLDNPHVFLDEIMRQEEGSEIIQLSMKIRNHEPLELFQGKNVQVIDKSQLVSGVLTWADQIIVAKNNTRIEYNNKLREMLGYGPEPQEGDKVVCLRNYWDECSIEERDALVNGTIGYLKHPTNKTIFFPKFLKLQCGKSVIATTADIVTPEGDYYPHIDCDKKMIIEGEKCMDWRDSYALGKLKDRYGDLVPKEITYGYAITCWKAQGSQWDKVLLFEENFPFDKEEHFRYLYTGITRAINKIVVVRK